MFGSNSRALWSLKIEVMNVKTKRFVSKVIISAMLIGILATGALTACSHSTSDPHASSKATPKTPAAASSVAGIPTPQPKETAKVKTPEQTPKTSQKTPSPSNATGIPTSQPNVSLAATQLTNSNCQQVLSVQDEAVDLFNRLNTGQKLIVGPVSGSKAGLYLKSARSDKYGVTYDMTLSNGKSTIDTTFSLLTDTNGFYNANIFNQKANTLLKDSLANGVSSGLTSQMQQILDKVNLDMSALGGLQSIYAGPLLSRSSGTGLQMTYDINDDRTIYTLTKLKDGVAIATTTATLPRSLKGCVEADKNNATSIGQLESGVAFLQSQGAAQSAISSQSSLEDMTFMQDMVKRALYVTLLKRWLDPFCDDVILSQDPTKFPATGTFLNSIKIIGNSTVSDLTKSINVVDPGGSNTVYTVRGTIIDALNQSATDGINNTGVEENLISEQNANDGYKSIVAHDLLQIAFAADEHINDLINQQTQVPFPLRSSTSQVYKGILLNKDPKTQVNPKDGMYMLRTQMYAADIEALSVRYSKNGAIADTVLWIAITPSGVDTANAHEIQAQADLNIYAVKFDNAAIDDLVNLHAAIISQNNNVKKTGNNLTPVPPGNDEILRTKVQNVFAKIDPRIPILIKSDPRLNGANGILPSKDFQVANNGSCLNCYIQFSYRDTIIKRDPIELDFQLPLTESGRVKTALPSIQALIENPPATLPGDAGIPSMAEFLREIRDYISLNLVSADITSK